MSGNSQTRQLSFRLYLLAILILCIAAPTRAQETEASPSPTATPTEEERKIQEEIRILELKKTREELKKAIRESQPQPTATPLEGKTEIDEKVVLETQMASYKAMSNVADKIAAEIKKSLPNATAIAVYQEQEISDWKYYRATSAMFDAQIEALKQQYIFTLDALQPAGAAAFDPVTLFSSGATVLRSFVDLISIFRTDTKLEGVSVTIEEKALIAEMFRALRNKYNTPEKKITLYYPLKYPPESLQRTCSETVKDASGQPVRENGRDKVKTVFCSPTLQKIAELYALKTEADRKLITDNFRNNNEIEKDTRIKTRAEEKIAEINAKIAKLNETAATPALTSQIQSLEAQKNQLEQTVVQAENRIGRNALKKSHLDRLNSLNQQVDSFLTAFAQKDETSRRSNLLTYLRAESLDQALAGNESYWFAVSSISAGGNNRVRKNLVFYPLGAKIDHSGGIIVEWQIYRKDGASMDSNTDRSYDGYKSPKSLKDSKGSSKDKVADPVVP